MPTKKGDKQKVIAIPRAKILSIRILMLHTFGKEEMVAEDASNQKDTIAPGGHLSPRSTHS